MVGSRYNKKRNFLTRLILGGHKMSRFPNLLPESLERGLYRAFNTVQMVQIPHWSLQSVSVKIAPTVGMVDRVYIPRTRKDVRSPDCPGSALGSTGSHDLSMICFNTLSFVTSSSYLRRPPLL